MSERASARPLSELDRGTRERLEALMGKDANSLTEGDRVFLTARKDYLTAEQRKDYGIKGAVNLDDPDTDADEDEGDEYDEMSKDELKDLLAERGLPVSGKLDELRERLRADDAAE